MIIFSAIIVENAVFLESFVNELLLPLMDIIKLFLHRKQNSSPIRAHIQNDTKFDSVKFNLKISDIRYLLIASTMFVHHILILLP